VARSTEPRGVKELFPDEAKAYMDSHQEGTYTLLDVRQPFEYEEAHLPGAKLIPLPALADSLESLNPHQPILLYCAMGGRSRMAAQLLSNHGFDAVYQLQGGINAWEAPTASGPVAFHLKFVKGDEPPDRVIGIAYQMEEGLRKLHQEILSLTDETNLRSLLTQLIKAEESHQQALVRLLEKVMRGGVEQDSVLASLPASDEELIEGGIDVAAFMRQNQRFLETVSGYLELTMMIEAQALDLYLRMSSESRNPVTKAVLLQISEEEKGHLMMLGRYLESRSHELSA
jgi:sulfur-carrier protein adenylyltransferase/sulfurtransferase